MSHLLHIDSSVLGEASVTRRLSARARDRWLSVHPEGTVTYRDLAVDPIPHLGTATGQAILMAAASADVVDDPSLALSVQLIDEIRRADVILIGFPLYNFGPPSTVKAWVDHIVVPVLSLDVATHTGLLGGTDVIVLASHGGGYGPGTPREGWDHATLWLAHALSDAGLVPRFITAELTMADFDPALADLKGLATDSLNSALASIDQLWANDAALIGVSEAVHTP